MASIKKYSWTEQHVSLPYLSINFIITSFKNAVKYMWEFASSDFCKSCHLQSLYHRLKQRANSQEELDLTPKSERGRWAVSGLPQSICNKWMKRTHCSTQSLVSFSSLAILKVLDQSAAVTLQTHNNSPYWPGSVRAASLTRSEITLCNHPPQTLVVSE